jgi:hypothetical protein
MDGTTHRIDSGVGIVANCRWRPKLADDAAAAAMFRLPVDWTQVRPPASLGRPSGGPSWGEPR